MASLTVGRGDCQARFFHIEVTRGPNVTGHVCLAASFGTHGILLACIIMWLFRMVLNFALPKSYTVSASKPSNKSEVPQTTFTIVQQKQVNNTNMVCLSLDVSGSMGVSVQPVFTLLLSTKYSWRKWLFKLSFHSRRGHNS